MQPLFKYYLIKSTLFSAPFFVDTCVNTTDISLTLKKILFYIKPYETFSRKVAKVQDYLEVYALKKKLGRNFCVLEF